MESEKPRSACISAQTGQGLRCLLMELLGSVEHKKSVIILYGFALISHLTRSHLHVDVSRSHAHSPCLRAFYLDFQMPASEKD